MSTADYLGGLAWFVPMLAGTLGGTAILVRKRLPHLAGAPLAVSFALIATGALLAVHIVPGALGILSRPSVLVATVAWVVVALAVRPVHRPAVADIEPPRDHGVLRWAAFLGAGAVLVFVVATAFSQIAVAPRAVDLMNFHLPGVARWIQSGSMWPVSELLPNVAPGTYPNNGDVILLAAVLPWHNDFLAHLAPYPYYLLTGTAVYALALELGATRAWGTLGAAIVLATPAVAVTALVAGLVDPVFLATFAGGLLFGVRHRRTAATSDLVLAGLGLGIAFGTKWYAVPAVAIVAVVWALARLAAREERGRVLRELAVVGALVVAAGGIWLLRNWIEVGNPIFPLRIEAFGTTIFSAPHDVVRSTAGFTLLDYVGDWQPWGRVILPQLRNELAAPAALLCIGAVASAALLLVGRRFHWRPGRGALGVLLAAFALLALAYFMTPYTAGGPAGHPTLTGADARYAGAALVLMASVAAAIVTPLSHRWGAALGVLCLLAVADGLRSSSGGAGSLASLGAGDWAVGLGTVVLAGAVVMVVRTRPPRMPVAAILAGCAILVAVAIVGGYVVQRHFNDHRYLGDEPAIDWITHHAPSGERIGLAGLWDDAGMSPVLPAFGPRLGNDVAYIGRSRDGFLYRYRSGRGFASALRRGRYRLLVVGLGRPGFRRAPERRWAIDAGYRPVVKSPRLELLAAPPGPLGKPARA